MDEMIKHFNDVVSAMSISIKDKMTILGLITAIGYKYQDDCKTYQDIIETDRDEIQWLKKCVNDLSAADVRPVVRGEWIWTVDDDEYLGEYWKCNLCGEHSYIGYNFCPNCGVDMRESKQETKQVGILGGEADG